MLFDMVAPLRVTNNNRSSTFDTKAPFGGQTLLTTGTPLTSPRRQSLATSTCHRNAPDLRGDNRWQQARATGTPLTSPRRQSLATSTCHRNAPDLSEATIAGNKHTCAVVVCERGHGHALGRWGRAQHQHPREDEDIDVVVQVDSKRCNREALFAAYSTDVRW
jgi:hypothetical protein